MSRPLVTVSLVIPTYNAADKILDPMAALAPLTNDENYEIIFVDDCSTDATWDIVREFSQKFENVKVTSLDSNSGGASRPRNVGLGIAKSDYVFFLDADDPVDPLGLEAARQLATRDRPDIVRMPIDVRYDNEGVRAGLTDRIPGWSSATTYTDKVAKVVEHQSLTVSCLFRRALVMSNGIVFDEARRIGEDIVFTAQCLRHASSIEYSDSPARSYIRSSAEKASVTQSIRSRDFGEFFTAWSVTEDTLRPLGVSFIGLHGFAAMNYCLRQYLWFKTGALESTDFSLAHNFVNTYRATISEFQFPVRIQEMLDAIMLDSLDQFNEVARLRILVAGHDLKFMEDIVIELSEKYSIVIDRWESHTEHNEARSLELLDRADIIWCEWLLGNAVWYSHRKRSEQLLFIRCHRSELTANYGERVKHDAVTRFIVISPHGLDDFSDRFAFKREKFEVIPNRVNGKRFTRRSVERKFARKILMVGSVPRLKGLHRAIELLSELRRHSKDYSLSIFGRRPDELSWVVRNPSEREYYELCMNRIEFLGLGDSISFCGWTELEAAYAEHDILVSLSDYEGCQVAPLESMAAGLVPVVRPWRGSETCYPSMFVVPDSRIVEQIISLDDPVNYAELVSVGTEHVHALHSRSAVTDRIERLISDCVR